MIKEIGGYFGLECGTSRKEYYSSLIKLNLGRNALVYLLRAKKIKKIFVPFFVCESVLSTCKNENVEIEYYLIDKDFKPILNKQTRNNEALYIINYYGQINSSYIKKLRKFYKNIILDNVQAFFIKPINGIDTIYSCRKFFGVPDGAYLATSSLLNEKLARDDSSTRLKHLLGRNKDGATAHYNEYIHNEEILNTLELKEMSSFTSELLTKIDYEKVIKCRNRNFKCLAKFLNRYNQIKIKKSKGPFSYPFKIEKGKLLREKMIQNKIFVPLLWPNIIEENSKKFAENILPLPCDQRYCKNDMLSIVQLISDFKNSISINVDENDIELAELGYKDVFIINRWHNDEFLYKTLVGKCYHPSILRDFNWIHEYKKDFSKFRGIIIYKKRKIGVVYLTNIDNKTAEFEIFIAYEKYRGKHIASIIMKNVINQLLFCKKFEQIVLYTLKDNDRAQHLYKSKGFVEIENDSGNASVIKMVLKKGEYQ